MIKITKKVLNLSIMSATLITLTTISSELATTDNVTKKQCLYVSPSLYVSPNLCKNDEAAIGFTTSVARNHLATRFSLTDINPGTLFAYAVITNNSGERILETALPLKFLFGNENKTKVGTVLLNQNDEAYDLIYNENPLFSEEVFVQQIKHFKKKILLFHAASEIGEDNEGLEWLGAIFADPFNHNVLSKGKEPITHGYKSPFYEEKAGSIELVVLE